MKLSPPLTVETSATMPTHAWPIFAAASAARLASRPHNTTRTPSLASACAVAKPRPAEPPATAAVRPVSPRSIRVQVSSETALAS